MRLSLAVMSIPSTCTTASLSFKVGFPHYMNDRYSYSRESPVFIAIYVKILLEPNITDGVGHHSGHAEYESWQFRSRSRGSKSCAIRRPSAEPCRSRSILGHALPLFSPSISALRIASISAFNLSIY
jgi:hypothetical protein